MYETDTGYWSLDAGFCTRRKRLRYAKASVFDLSSIQHIDINGLS